MNALSSARAAAAEPSHDRNAGKPLTSPTHLRPIAVEIPAAWTPEEALAVFELLEELREKIWVRYSIQMQELLEEQQGRFGVNQGNADTAAGDEPTF